MDSRSATLKGTLLVALSAFLFGFLGYLGTKVMSENLSIENMLFWRFLIASIWMMGILLKVKNHSDLLVNCDWNCISLIILLGVTGSVSTDFYFISSQYLGTGLAMALFYSYPILLVPLSCFFFKTKVNEIIIISVLFLMIGVYFLGHVPGDTFELTGIVYGLIASFGYAVYIIAASYLLRKNIHPAFSIFMITFMVSVTFFTLSLLQGPIAIVSTFSGWMHLLGLGIFATAVPLQLLFYGLKLISSVRASMVTTLEPVFTVAIGVVLLHESVTNLQMLGATIIILSGLMVQLQKRI